ncbi:response regulator transcription factor [Candidatus Palauibacter sp.]|uniref:response regulator transcription factor n=1 Tax=Candidatus Palauibacter sp. TaxID=3101350 RepID=UPI003B5BB795
MVDNDPQTLRYVRDVLSRAGYAPIVAGDPNELSIIIRAEKPRLVLLDLMLPSTDGIEVMGRIPELADLPVIFISGYRREEMIARALETGAADYIVKPFSPTELVARIRAALRRRAEPETFVLGDLAVDSGRRRVNLGGRKILLTPIEFEFLRILLASGGRVVTTEALLRKVWGHWL